MMLMKVSKLLFLALFLGSLLLFSFLPSWVIHSPGEVSSDTKSATWTVMVYLNADNDLNDAGWEDVNEMEVVGSTVDVNVLALVDSYDVAIPYEIHKDTDMDNVGSQILVGTGLPSEPNMGQAGTLSAWVDYVQTNYVSTYYALIIWNHGAGFYGISWDESSDDDRLTLNEVQTALTGKGLDVLCADACLMGMTEVAYEWKNLADYIVFSEETIPWDGYPYNDFLQAISATTTPEQFCTTMVNAYADSYNGGSQGNEQDSTLSAIDTSKMDALVTSLDDFTAVMLSNSSWMGQASYARYHTESFSYPENIDLGDFMKELQTFSTIPQVDAAAAAVRGNLTDAIVINNVLSHHSEAEGLAILLPEDQSDYPQGYDTVLDFGVNSSWDDFIADFVGYKATASENPEIQNITLSTDYLTPEEALTVQFHVEIDTNTATGVVDAQVYYRDYLLWNYEPATLINTTSQGSWWQATIPPIPKGAGHDLQVSCRAWDDKGAMGQDMTSIYIHQAHGDPLISDLIVNPINITIYTDITVNFHVQTQNGTQINEVVLLYKDFLRWHSVIATQTNGTLEDGWWTATIPAISGGDGHVLQIKAQGKDNTGRVGQSKSFITVIGSLSVPTPGFTFLFILAPLAAIVVIHRFKKRT
ncbi:MAG: clostripain-related cysteine peptidase [Candidatus Hodarchaeota archaeon]